MVGVEQRLDRIAEQAFIGQRRSRGACPLEQGDVLAQPGEPQVGEPRLPRAEQLALATDLEIALGELESVGRRDHRLESLTGNVGELLLWARHEQAVR